MGDCSHCWKEDCKIVQLIPARPGWRSVYDDEPIIFVAIDMWALWLCGNVTPLDMSGGSWEVPKEAGNYVCLLSPGMMNEQADEMVQRDRKMKK